MGKTVEISGGDKLQKRLEEIAAGLASGGLLRVGFLEGAGHHTGTNLPMASIAAFQEFGAPAAGIPPRPFFRNMIAKHVDEWGDQLAANLHAMEYDAASALHGLGQDMQGQLQQSMTDLDSPPLSQVTLMLRKMRMNNQDLVVTGKTVGEAARRVAEGKSTAGVSDKPLIDTGELQKGVDFEVQE